MTPRYLTLLGTMLTAEALVATAATAAPGSSLILKDATGDATDGAADIETITAVNDTDGTITVSLVFAHRPALTSDDLAVLPVDSDANASTGDTGLRRGRLRLRDQPRGRTAHGSRTLGRERMDPDRRADASGRRGDVVLDPS